MERTKQFFVGLFLVGVLVFGVLGTIYLFDRFEGILAAIYYGILLTGVIFIVFSGKSTKEMVKKIGRFCWEMFKFGW